MKILKTKNYYYVLRKDYLDTSISELKALIETYDLYGNITYCFESICIAEHRDYVVYKVMSRASFLKRAGYLISIDNILSPKLDYLNELSNFSAKWVKIHIHGYKRNRELVEKYVGQLINKTGLVTEYRRGDYIEIFFINNSAVIGYPLATRRKYIDRKTYTRSTALPVELSRLLINLARVKEGETLLDPFVGTGTILIEANSMNIFAIGVDIDYEVISIARFNLNNCGLNKYILIHGDSRELLYMSADGVATNPPYGRGSSTRGTSIAELYEKFIRNASDSIKKNRYIVFVTSSSLENIVDETIYKYGLLLEKKHYIYTHGSLTRIVYEVRNI